jgi:hypothetical protein
VRGTRGLYAARGLDHVSGSAVAFAGINRYRGFCFEKSPRETVNVSAMTGLISHLTKDVRRKLLADLNYLNMGEIKSFCKKHELPCAIAIETRDGKRRRSGEYDRKGVMLERVRQFLETGVIREETCFRAGVVCFDPLPKKSAAGDRLFYGQYGRTNRAMIVLLKELTNGEFEDGAIARILARDFWASDTAPTFKEFAAAWRKAREEHNRPNPEWAFLSDRTDKTAGADWKKLRVKKAKRVMKTLSQIGGRSRGSS